MVRPIVVALEPDGNAPHWEIPLGTRGAVRAGISLAHAGDMSSEQRCGHPHRRRLLDHLGVRADRLRTVKQVHSRRVVAVDGSEPADGPFAEADGMVSDRPELLLAVTVADCLPVFLLDPQRTAFGIVHSGWKGTGIVAEAIRLMGARYGCRGGDLVVAIGPGIGPCCYAVTVERAERFAAEFGPAAVVRGPSGDVRLDLRAANLGLLEREGVGAVIVVDACTSCAPSLGSFRRQGPERFTRMLAFIGGWGAPLKEPT